MKRRAKLATLSRESLFAKFNSSSILISGEADLDLAFIPCISFLLHKAELCIFKAPSLLPPPYETDP